jgi:hypothetical protein
VFTADLRGQGIRETMLFEVIGALAFPVFYGCCVAAVVMQLLMLPLRDRWLTLSNGSLTAGRRQISLNDVRDLQVRRNWIGLRELVFRLADGSEFRTKVYLLERPLRELIPELKSLISDTQVRSQIAGR